MSNLPARSSVNDDHAEAVTTAPKMHSRGCSLPKKPDHEEHGVGFCREVSIKLICQDGFLDMLIFAPSTGHCPHCESGKIHASRICSCAKLVCTLACPMHCLGMDVDFTNCNRSIKSFDSCCVATLPRHHRLQMPFLQTGQSLGVHNNLIRFMRLGQPGSVVATSQQASLRVKHEAQPQKCVSQAVASLKCDNKLLGTIGHNDNKPFPPSPDNWAIQSHTVIAAFLRDYQIHRSDLC